MQIKDAIVLYEAFTVKLEQVQKIKKLRLLQINTPYRSIFSLP